MKKFFGGIIHSLITWEWTKKLLHWIIISAGTMSECAFLIASLWVSINANVHSFVLLFISEEMTKHITQLATTAYVALPECIVGLAVVVTLSHLRVWLYSGKKEYRAFIWMILYGLPTLVFLGLSLITLGCSVASVDFQMPTALVVTRALAGYVFAFTSLLYTQIGVPQERDRLAQKDEMIQQLRLENAQNLDTFRREKDEIIHQLQQKSAEQTAEIGQLKTLLEISKNAEASLQKAVHKSDDSTLEAYSEECNGWLKSGVKTVSVDEITQFTGHSKRKITSAITGGMLQTSSRNKELILVSSLLEWLKHTPVPSGKMERDTSPLLRAVK